MTRRERAQAYLDRFEFRGIFVALRARLYIAVGHSSSRDVLCAVEVWAHDVFQERAEPQMFVRMFRIDPDAPDVENDRCVFDALDRLMAHEVHEGVWRDGTCVRDPHVRKG